ncbi:MAG: hypothetical protein JO287_18370 [Pseudonocardiales bacterium]|nr:hypothetical protein [Pseudonocardiales bacterium]
MAITTVLGGAIFSAAGVAAAADQGRPTGGDNSSAQACDSADRYSDPGCMLGWGPFFK